tara:strand:- start:19971 stop:21233 length:1263 start_codon:yes stop_codon:yes gene_type:complete
MALEKVRDYYDKEKTKIKTILNRETDTGLISEHTEFSEQGERIFHAINQRLDQDGNKFFQQESNLFNFTARDPKTGKNSYERKIVLNETTGQIKEDFYDEKGNPIRASIQSINPEITKNDKGNIVRMDYGFGKVKDQYGLDMPVASLIFDEDGILEKSLVRNYLTKKLNNINTPKEDEYPPLKYDVVSSNNELRIKEKGSDLLNVIDIKEDGRSTVYKNEFKTATGKRGFEFIESAANRSSYNTKTGNIVRSIDYLENNEMITTNYKDGIVREKKYTHGPSTTPYKHELYNDQGLLINQKNYNKGNYDLESEINIEYNGNIKKVSETRYKNHVKDSTVTSIHKDGEIKKVTVENNKTGTVEVEENYQINDEGQSVLKSIKTENSFTEYDENGNMLGNVPEVSKKDLEKLVTKKSTKKRKP